MTCLNDFDFRDFLSYVLDQSESIYINAYRKIIKKTIFFGAVWSGEGIIVQKVENIGFFYAFPDQELIFIFLCYAAAGNIASGR